MARPRLHHVIDGSPEAPPIILLHGFPLDHSMWAPQAIHLANKGFQVIRPDLRGHGASPVPDEVSTMEHCVDDVLGLADQLNLKTFRLGGFSLGGYVALELIRRAPERVQALLLVDTRADPDTDEAKAKRRAFIDRIQKNGAAALEETMLPQLLTEQTRRQRPELVGQVRQSILRTPTKGAINALRGMMERPDQRPNLARIRVPTLVVVGAEDKLTPLDAARAMAQAIPGSQLRIVTNAAHLVPLEQPQPLNHFLDHWVTGLRDKPQLMKKEAPGS